MSVARSTTQPTGSPMTRVSHLPPDDEIIIISSDDEHFVRPTLPRRNRRDSRSKQGNKQKENVAGGTYNHVLLENRNSSGSFPHYDVAAFRELKEKHGIMQADLSLTRSALDVEKAARTDMKERNNQLQKQVQSLQTELFTLKEKLDQRHADNNVCLSYALLIPRKNLTMQQMLEELEERILCEICQNKLWRPFVLECGHTACRDCLVDWFETGRRSHQTLTCPKCRALVRHRPAENFAVKEFVQLIAHPATPSPSKRSSELRPFYHLFGY